MENEKQLLPTGFHDVLPPDAALEAKVVSTLSQRMALCGYLQVKPPLLEFESSALGSDTSLSRQAFRVMDPASGRYMALRPDMTLQIARMASVRLKDAPRPLRLSYAGQVIRVEGEGLYAERQLAQVGAELIGSPAPEADAEVVHVAAEALEVAGLKGLTVDFSLPTLQTLIYSEERIADSEQLEMLVARKDISALKQLNTKTSLLLSELLHLAGDATLALNTLKSLPLPASAGHLVVELEAVVARLVMRLPAVRLTIDPLESCGFNYHNGVAFTLFAEGAAEELGRGGRYTLEGGESAVGFTLSANAVLRALPVTIKANRVYLPFGTSSDVARKLRDEGYETVICLSDVRDIQNDAKRLNCQFLYLDGKVSALEG